MQLRPIKIQRPHFYLKIKKDKSGQHRIDFRLRMPDMQYFNYSTGWKIISTHWDLRTERAKTNIKGKFDEYTSMNEALEKYQRIGQDVFSTLVKNNPKFDRETYRAAFLVAIGAKSETLADGTSFFAFFQNHIEQLKQRPDSAETSWKKFQGIYNLLKTYSDEIGSDLDWKELDWDFLNKFRDWLFLAPRKYSQNTVNKYFEVIRSVMREGHRRNLHTNTVFNDSAFGVRRVKSRNKVRLSFDEIELLAALDLSDNERLERVRDLFIYICYTGGPRISDWEKLNANSIVTKEGVEMLQLVSKKTSTLSYIPLFPIAKQILLKYNFELPVISSQKFNAYIKEVGELALKDRKFLRIYSQGGQTHTESVDKWTRLASTAARRSFCTNFYEKGIPAVHIMQVSGHSTEKSFFAYIDLNQEAVAHQFAQRAAKILHDAHVRKEGDDEPQLKD